MGCWKSCMVWIQVHDNTRVFPSLFLEIEYVTFFSAECVESSPMSLTFVKMQSPCPSKHSAWVFRLAGEDAVPKKMPTKGYMAFDLSKLLVCVLQFCVVLQWRLGTSKVMNCTSTAVVGASWAKSWYCWKILTFHYLTSPNAIPRASCVAPLDPLSLQLPRHCQNPAGWYSDSNWTMDIHGHDSVDPCSILFPCLSGCLVFEHSIQTVAAFFA